MDNYHYIVASLPVLSPDYKFASDTPDSIMAEILAQLSDKDKAVVEFLEKGFEPDNLCAEFYNEALSHDSQFIRDYFAFDLAVRNAKAEYLNDQLGRPAGKDVLVLNQDEDCEPEQVEFEEAAKLDGILHSGDILTRERGIDDLLWEKIDAMTLFDYFNMEIILGFVAKLHIVARWFKLDEESGRQMFKKLVDEVRGTFKGVQYNAN